MERIAFYGGTFDPVHLGHLTVATRLLSVFALDRFVFLPAFHAPHKSKSNPAPAYHRFAMLALATKDLPHISISTLELEHAKKRYTVESLAELKENYPTAKLFFVMGADSWMDIRTWKDWEKVLLMTDQIVVTRPGYEIRFDHVSDSVRSRIVDLRGDTVPTLGENTSTAIYITDAVEMSVSASLIRKDVSEDDRLDDRDRVPDEVAKYIEKYELYR